MDQALSVACKEPLRLITVHSDGAMEAVLLQPCHRGVWCLPWCGCQARTLVHLQGLNMAVLNAYMRLYSLLTFGWCCSFKETFAALQAAILIEEQKVERVGLPAHAPHWDPRSRHPFARELSMAVRHRKLAQCATTLACALSLMNDNPLAVVALEWLVEHGMCPVELHAVSPVKVHVVAPKPWCTRMVFAACAADVDGGVAWEGHMVADSVLDHQWVQWHCRGHVRRCWVVAALACRRHHPRRPRQRRRVKDDAPVLGGGSK